MAINLASNLHPKVAKHIDDRFQVATEKDLNTGGPLYPGMLRYVVDEDKLYKRKKDNTWAVYGEVIKGDEGSKGDDGVAATIEIGTVTSGTTPSVTNAGTDTSAIFNFVLPKGDKGDSGDKGDDGDVGPMGPAFDIDGRGSYADMDNYLDQPIGTAYLVEEQGHQYHGNIFILGEFGWGEPISFTGNNGWSPELSAFVYSDSITVLQLVSWIGGQGIEPINLKEPGVSYYVSPTGYTTDISKAVNIRGPQGTVGGRGPEGLPGDTGGKGDTGDSGASVYLAFADDSAGSGYSESSSGKTHVSFVIATSPPAQSVFKNWTKFKGDAGSDGISAYDVAVANGYKENQTTWLASLKGENAALTETITVTGTNGQVLPNTTVLAKDMTFTAVMKKILMPETFPSYTQPSASISPSSTITVEKGTTQAQTYTPTFTQGDAGSVTSYTLTRAHTPPTGSPVVTNNLSNTSGAYADSFIIDRETVVIRATYNYGQGVEKFGTQGTSAPGRISAGTRDAARTINGILPWFYGTSDTNTIGDIYDGTKVIATIGSSVVIPSLAVGNKFLWFAVPKGTKTFTAWSRGVLDYGNMGGTTNLFGSKVARTVSSKLLTTNWTNEDYDFYITNWATPTNVATTLT